MNPNISNEFNTNENIIQDANPLRKSSYAILPSFIMENVNLADGAKLLYARISMYSEEGRCWASNKHFMTKHNVSERTIQNWITQLVKAGYIEIEIYEHNKRNIWLSYDMKKSISRDSYPRNKMQGRGAKEEGGVQPIAGGGCNLLPPVIYKTSIKNTSISDEDIGLSHFLYESLKKINPSILEPKFETWAKQINQIREKDGRPTEDIKKVIQFLEWQHSNIPEKYRFVVLCPTSLREKYASIYPKMISANASKNDNDGKNRQVDIIKENQQIAKTMANKVKHSGRSSYSVDEGSVRITFPDGQYFPLSFAEHGFRDQLESKLRIFRML